MNILDKTLKGLDGLALRLVWLGGALLVLAALIVTVDVILRKIFNISMAKVVGPIVNITAKK